MTHSLPTQLFSNRQLVTNPVELIPYEIDAGFDRGVPHGAVYVESAADVSRLVRWAMQERVPLVARGAGTGLAGGAVAVQGGIVVIPSRMNRILNLDVRGRTAHVQPGVTNLAVDSAARRVGLYFPPDPSSGRASVIGGNIGTNAGGPHCFKYGVTTNYVQGVRAVLGDGTVVQLGGPALDYPEYDLLGAMVGSEGTLGFVTEAWLRLIGNPPAVKTMMVSFDSEAQAGKAVSAVINAGLSPATLELMDQRSMRMIEEFTAAGLPVDAGAALIVEVDGYPESLDTQIEEVADLLFDNGGRDVRIAQSEEERANIWYGRKSAAGAFSRIAPSYYLTDITVRRSLLAPVLSQILDVCDKYQVQTANFFHAGDGNLHPLILCDESDAELMDRVHEAGKEIIRICLDNDGSITGEHGVGIEKRPYMSAMFSVNELAAMRAIKEVFDPAGVCNPGKVLPEDDGAPAQTVAPSVVQIPASVAPATAEDAATIFAACSREKRSICIGSAEDGPRGSTHIWLSTHKLDGVIDFQSADLFVTVGAGMRVRDLHDFLTAHNVQAPLASPWPDSTVGGLISSNLNAPLRMRYGALRDLLLCAVVVLADGRVLRAGRPLVKNVAGYDLPKLFVGAYGTLGLMTEVTLKLTPLPRVRRTLAVPVADLAGGLKLAGKALTHALTASSIIVTPDSAGVGLKAPNTLLYTAEGLGEDVAAEIDAVTGALRRAGAAAIIETDYTGLRAWSGYLETTANRQMLVRVGLPASSMDEFVSEHTDLIGAALVDAASGHLFPVLDPREPRSVLDHLQTVQKMARAVGGYAVVLSSPPGLSGYDRWGHRPSAFDAMRRLKDRWDPAGILNPNLFVV